MGFNLGPVSNSYATGSVTGVTNVGGLVGFNYNGTINNSYATGSVTGVTNVGRLVGLNDGGISNSYWNADNAGSVGIGADTTNGTGLTSVIGLTGTQMQNAANFIGFNFNNNPGAGGNNWVIVSADGTLQTGTETSGGATTPMLMSEYATRINNAHQLQLMALDLTASYTLGNNVNAAATGLIGGISTDVWGSAGFVPIGGFGGNPFTGSFDGGGQTISNLVITRPSSIPVGLFGFADMGAMVQNVGLVNASVSGNTLVGGLVGANSGTVSNSYATGTVIGNTEVGGLVGGNAGTVSNSYATGSVTGVTNVGGLVGFNYNGTINNSYATGTVIGNTEFGGLVGGNDDTVSNSYATGSVTGVTDVGGLVGGSGGMVSNSYATGHVNGSSDYAGGLIGYNDATVSNSYATGNVTGVNYVGGLTGVNDNTINHSYATGTVSGNTYVGGLVGRNNDVTTSISNAYWNTGTAGTAGIGAGTTSGLLVTNVVGLTSAQMQQQSNFSDFDFVAKWIVYDGHTNPLLRHFMTPLTVTADDIHKTYARETTTGTGISFSTTPNSSLHGTLDYNNSFNAGSYAASGFYSDQQGYLISYSGGTLRRQASITCTSRSMSL